MLHLHHLERPNSAPPDAREIAADIGPTYAINGLIGFIFAATGPVAIILAVGTRGGLTQTQLASWIFGAFFVNGLVTLLMSWRYRAPLGFAWTIPGTVLVGPALQHLSFAQVVGAFYATSLLLVLLGASGWVKRVMAALPMPIVMGMVGGVFLRFGLDLIHGLHHDFAIAGPMVLTYLALSTFAGLGRRLPPVIGALLAGIGAAGLSGSFDTQSLGNWQLASPVLTLPDWSAGAMVELVLPLAITVLVVQNGQGVAVLRSAGYAPPVNMIAVACGVGAALSAAVGAVSSCLTGPTNALLTSSGEPRRQYTAALSFGILAMGFGLMAPTFTGLMLGTPKAFIMVLGGLAMLRVLQGAFVAAFGTGRFTLGALVSLLVTVADQGLLNIGAAFWALLAGTVVAWLMERQDFSAAATDR